MTAAIGTLALLTLVSAGVAAAIRTANAEKRCAACRHPRYDHARKMGECWHLDCRCKGMRENG